MKRILTPAIIAITSILFLNGCLKDKNADTETTSATDNSICENEFMRLLPTVNKIAIDEPGVQRLGSGNSTQSSCPDVTVPDSTGQYPRHMVIDYGTGCTDPIDGKMRSGKIRATLTLPWDSVGSVITLSLDTYMVAGIHYEGTVELTRTGANSFHKIVTNGKCTKTSATAPWTILFASTHDITFTSGSTVSSDPQIITLTGSNSGTDRNGTTWTSNITSPVVRDLNCTWITKGTIDLIPNGKPTRTVDFGDGTCDNKGTITISGNKFEFSMQ
jgi:hypothetical protein